MPILRIGIYTFTTTQLLGGCVVKNLDVNGNKDDWFSNLTRGVGFGMGFAVGFGVMYLLLLLLLMTVFFLLGAWDLGAI